MKTPNKEQQLAFGRPVTSTQLIDRRGLSGYKKKTGLTLPLKIYFAAIHSRAITSGNLFFMNCFIMFLFLFEIIHILYWRRCWNPVFSEHVRF